MCRHLACLGPEEPLGRILVEPEHSLYRQSWAPRRQRYGTVNADGFGVGWYAPDDPQPARYRRAGPIWAEPGGAHRGRGGGPRARVAAGREARRAGAGGGA
ncbi:class II glutamine amidotransferase, partial [Streptomyces sp. NPDC059627]